MERGPKVSARARLRLSQRMEDGASWGSRGSAACSIASTPVARPGNGCACWAATSRPAARRRCSDRRALSRKTAEAAGIEVVPDPMGRGGARWLGRGDRDRRAKRPRDRPLGLRGDERVRPRPGGLRPRALLSCTRCRCRWCAGTGPRSWRARGPPSSRPWPTPPRSVFVRGSAHRRIFETAFGLRERRAADHCRSPSRCPPFSPAQGRKEILALTRHSPEKASIPRLAVELTREGLAQGRECRLTVAGEGPTQRAGRRHSAPSACRPDSWRFEGRARGPDRPARRRRRRRRPGLDDTRGGGAGTPRRRRPQRREGERRRSRPSARVLRGRRRGTRSGTPR